MGGWVLVTAAAWVVASVVVAVLLASTVRLRDRHDVRPRLRRPHRAAAPRAGRGTGRDPSARSGPSAQRRRRA